MSAPPTTAYLVHKKLRYKISAMRRATTSEGTPLPGQWLAEVLDPHTQIPFHLLITQEMLDMSGYVLMGGSSDVNA